MDPHGSAPDQRALARHAYDGDAELEKLGDDDALAALEAYEKEQSRVGKEAAEVMGALQESRPRRGRHRRRHLRRGRGRRRGAAQAGGGAARGGGGGGGGAAAAQERRSWRRSTRRGPSTRSCPTPTRELKWPVTDIFVADAMGDYLEVLEDVGMRSGT